MPRHQRTLLPALLLFLVPVVSAQSLSERELGHSIDRVLAEEALAHALWGVHVIDLESGRAIYEHNAGKNFVPASNVKLYTTAAALELLGPDFRYETTVWTDGVIDGNVLRGNLIVRGSGDPAIGGRFHDGDQTFVFRSWADSLRALGVSRIEGDIIGDDDIFDDVPLGRGWSWSDEPYWYSAEISGLSFNDNNVDFEIRARRMGEPAEISWEPHNTSYVSVINRTETVHPDSSLNEGYARRRATNAIEISSRVPEGRTDLESLTVTNPTLFFVHVFRESLLDSGIAVDGDAVDVDDLSIKPNYEDASTVRLATYTSVPLNEIVDIINKRSQNLYAEQVLRTIGAVRPVDRPQLQPGSAAMGVAASIDAWVRAGVDTSHFRIADGSGLSRHNLVSPAMTTGLLRHMWHHPDSRHREVFVSSLPIGGVDGTLRTRFRSGRAFQNVQAKTGSLSGVSSLSGYVSMRNGRRVAFSIMVNNYAARAQQVREAQDAIVELLASW